jgi:hypothetical protein
LDFDTVDRDFNIDCGKETFFEEGYFETVEKKPFLEKEIPQLFLPF